MMVLIKKTNINFISKRFIFFGFSALLIAVSAASMAVKGLNLGLDFTGGTLLQVKFEQPVTTAQVREAMAKAGLETSIQSFTGRNAYQIKVKGTQEKVNEIADKMLAGFTASFPGNTYTEEKRDYVGPVVGRDLAKKALFAFVLSLFGIIVYVAFRFSNPVWGAAGVIALLHDVFIAAGAMSVTNREIDLVIVAALLTIAGYSINDTIVIFDRMRENIRMFPKMALSQLVNTSINETLSRTLLTNFTVLTVVAVLFFAGGEVINNFAFCMLVGSIFGTYSTIAIATPLVYQWEGKGK
ncbi:MAG: protein-export membrane protein SecF [Elusimicrobia bacterium GWA2_64_40]|nr:MAG: protein-export membrane protein SecF [Elusimicrobia bacterium GWA2_64_40]HAN05306.1 protein translocase subunit SecF [Elusimicrobiota bacterium]